MIDPQDAAKLILGDCLEVLRTLPDNSVDSIVTDPPYGLTANKKGGTGQASVNLESPYGRSRIGAGNGPGGFMGLKWDSDVPPVEVWAECLRVLKPGGYLLAFAGTRTQHRMATRIEDAGFEIRDLIAWVYGSGFPKSLDVSKAIDKSKGATREVVGRRTDGRRTDGRYAYGFSEEAKKALGGVVASESASGFTGDMGVITAPATPEAEAWDGWGTALKPALEPITVARKPFACTVAENVLTHGVGALNIAACRIGDTVETWPASRSYQRLDPGAGSKGTQATGGAPPGRWPANLIHDGDAEVLALFPALAGGKGAVSGDEASEASDGTVGNRRARVPGVFHGDSGSAARFFYCAKASRADRNDGLEDPGPQFERGSTLRDAEKVAAEKRGNHHPTVKPTDLMRYLCRLVTPPGGLVLDPFMGSGSTGRGAVLEGFSFVGIEQEAAYMPIAHRRIEAAVRRSEQPEQPAKAAKPKRRPPKAQPKVQPVGEVARVGTEQEAANQLDLFQAA